jgi:hypothetical protein
MDIIKQIEENIITLNNQLVILDNNVADFYEVETKRINEAVKNNPEKFPEGYIVEVSPKDWLLMKSKFSTSLKGGKTKAPKAFTEKGLYMLAISRPEISCHTNDLKDGKSISTKEKT